MRRVAVFLTGIVVAGGLLAAQQAGQSQGQGQAQGQPAGRGQGGRGGRGGGVQIQPGQECPPGGSTDAEHIEGNSDKIKGLVLKTCFLRKA